ncbi:MAG: oligopeptide/dipeptide ABC transporter ATP-binding protein [Promethearchaeota archaeon]|jgi:oligopeptide/dipeptide ABC transporter ATP-binding protein
MVKISEKMNVLFIITDQQRADHLSCSGNPILKTPNLDKLASEGVNPSHPYTQALLASRSEIDPFKQEISFVIAGEVPSPIDPPSGCPFNPRCSSEVRTEECEYKSTEKIEIEEEHYIWCIKHITNT